MDSTSKIHNNECSDDAVTLALDNLSLTEVLSGESLCPEKDSVIEPTMNILPNLNCNGTSKDKPLVIVKSDVKAPFQTQDCALTILDDCCSLTNNYLSLNSTYVVPDSMASSVRDSINDKMKMDFVIRQNSQSNSHQQPNSLDCVITLYESSESDTSSYSESIYDSESADCLEYNNENELSYTIKRKSLTSGGESTEESSDSAEDSSDSHEDLDDPHDISNKSEDSSDSGKDSSDSDSASINDDSDEESTLSNDEPTEDSEEDSSTSSEEKPDSDEESEQHDDNHSSPIESSDSDESSDDDESVDLDESAESSESSDESD